MTYVKHLKGKHMRVIFNEELKAVADDLDRMAQDVRKAINGAGDALLNQNLEPPRPSSTATSKSMPSNPASSTSA